MAHYGVCLRQIDCAERKSSESPITVATLPCQQRFIFEFRHFLEYLFYNLGSLKNVTFLHLEFCCKYMFVLIFATELCLRSCMFRFRFDSSETN